MQSSVDFISKILFMAEHKPDCVIVNINHANVESRMHELQALSYLPLVNTRILAEVSNECCPEDLDKVSAFANIQGFWFNQYCTQTVSNIKQIEHSQNCLPLQAIDDTFMPSAKVNHLHTNSIKNISLQQIEQINRRSINLLLTQEEEPESEHSHEILKKVNSFSQIICLRNMKDASEQKKLNEKIQSCEKFSFAI